MSHRNFDKVDNTENVENVEKMDKPDGKEKEGFLNKAKNFFAEFGKKKESGEGKESKEDSKEDSKENSDKKEDSPKESFESKCNSFEERLRQGVPSMKEQAEIAKKYREEHNLDEHGYPTEGWKRPEGGWEREKGDDNPRSRFNDSGNEGKYEKKDKTESNESKNENNENKTDDE